MPIRERSGHWHYRFKVGGHEYTASTGLVATERNRTAANRIEAEALRLVQSGKAWELRLEVKPFTEAKDMFLDWAKGEYGEHPASALRLRTSFASLSEFFKGKAVSQITAGDIEDYKSWRRSVHAVRDITLRHDLHALSKFFGYAKKHNWTRDNQVKAVSIPSDKDAVRIHVVTDAEEKAYFAKCEEFGYQHLYDLARLMLLQGCRPEEILNLQRTDVDLEHGRLIIRRGKTPAARRELHLRNESTSILARRLMEPGRWVFASSKVVDAPITKLNNRHADVLEATGLRFVLYDWRHTFATRAAERGEPLANLAAILGHNNLRSVHKYVHPSQAALDDSMKRLDSPSAFCPPLGTKDSNSGQTPASSSKGAKYAN